MSIVIIYGAAGAGKSRRSEMYKDHFGCKRVVDGWDGLSKLRDGDLAITNVSPPFNVPDAKLVHVVKAKSAVHLMA